jgi:hypothetical protein
MPDILPDRPTETTERPQSNGQWLWKTLKPAGCVFVLVMAVIALIICFTSGTDPIKGYKAPQSTEYYAQHLDELCQELTENVLPQLEGEATARVQGNKVAVEIDHAHFVVTRSALLRYFDESLLELVQLEQ